MKKVMFALCGLVFGVVAANAQAAQPSNNAVATEQTAQQDDKVKIKAEELPQTVKTALEGEEYRGWLINAAYHHKTADTFEVELKNGAETKTIKFDKEGKKIS
ncbi:hypothetical protein [Dawidia soli]|uniref:PepSY domain-containing protein n=1 Tax=Dawidia soli TaxID=2782352 RepID=A0AAP2D6Y1_9BACT|nr:hypothetical protein [Dawidia soli]MBT1685706.1 hypothetical protein [Dawidia soli]